MRYDEMYVESTGVWFPPAVDVADAVASGAYDVGNARRADLGSVAVSDEPGVDLAARAIRCALQRSRFGPGDIDLLLYATANYVGLDAWNAAAYLQRETLTERALAVELRQLSNGGMAAIELAAGQLLAHPERRAAVLATGDRFALPGFDRWGTDPGIVWGDAGAALLLTRQPGCLRLLSLVNVTDPTLEGLYRGDAALLPSPDPDQMPVSLTRRYREFQARSDADDVRRRMRRGFLAAANQALEEADTSLDQVVRVVIPHLGRQLLERRYLAPLKLDLSRTTWEWGRTVGHLGVGDQFAGLDRVVSRDGLGPGDRVMVLSIAGGHVWGTAVLELVTPPPWKG
ncbi:MAG: ketoacyl-ACP synthase III family protein [Micromonosporaceae bacterium]